MADSNKDAAVSFLKLAASGKVREAYSKFGNGQVASDSFRLYRIMNKRVTNS